MHRVLLVCLIPITACLLHGEDPQSLNPNVGGGAARAAEIQQRTLGAEAVRLDLEAQARQHARDLQVRQQDYQRRFKNSFNQLVDALASFSKRYNEGRGNVWPREEADKLRKAMHQLEQVEKSLRDETK